MPNASALDARELSTLSRFELMQILDLVDHDHAAFSRVAIEAERALGKAEYDLQMGSGDEQTKAMCRKLTHELRATKYMLTALSRRQTRIEKILDAMRREAQ